MRLSLVVRAVRQAVTRRQAFGSTAVLLFLLKITVASGKSFTSVGAVKFGGLGVTIAPLVR
jgi:hypothetical protein